MTSEDLLTARAARREALRPAGLDPGSLRAWVRSLGLATLPMLGDGAAELLEEELAALQVVELWQWPGLLRYCDAEMVGYVYVCIGDRAPRQDYHVQANKGLLSWLAAETYELMLAAKGGLSNAELRERLGPERTSTLGMERALVELTRTLKVLRVGCRGGLGSEALWQPLALALPEVPTWVDRVSQGEAAAALASQYLDLQICESEENLALFFAPLFSRAKLHAALLGLEAARQVSLDSLDGRPAWRLRPPIAKPDLL